MKQSKRSLYTTALLFLCSAFALQAQEMDAVIQNFKAISFYNSGVAADSVLFLPENPEIGPATLEDTLAVFGPSGSFELNYSTEQEPVAVGLWIDLNQNDVFEEDERIYFNNGEEGMLADDLTIPPLNGPSRALLAISQSTNNLVDPTKIRENDRLSSLEFMMAPKSSPKLTMTSKKNTIDPDSTDCYTNELTFDLIHTEDTTDYVILAWTLTYPGSSVAPVGASISKTIDGSPFGTGSLIMATDPVVSLKLDFTGLGLVDGMFHSLSCTFAPVWDTTLQESAVLDFETCIVSSNKEHLANQQIFQLQLSPNPVSTQSRISYELPENMEVVVSLYDLQGRLIRILHRANEGPGQQQLAFLPEREPSGLYFLTLQTAKGRLTKKIMLSR